MSSAYLEQYTAMYHKNYGYDRPDAKDSPTSDPYGDWDTGFGDGEDYYQEALEELGENSEGSWDDPDYTGEDLAGDPMAPEETRPLSRVEQRRIDRLKEKRTELQKEFTQTQEELFNLEQGQGDPEAKAKKLEDLERELDEMINDLEDIEKLEERLGPDVSQNNDSLSELDPEYDALMADTEANQDMKTNLEEMKGQVESESEQVGKELRAQEIQKEIAELQETEAVDGEAMQEQFVDALGYLNGSKDRQYISAKVGSDGKHIFKYYGSATEYAGQVLSEMGAASLTGDWSNVKTLLDGIESTYVDDSLALVEVILSKHYPELLDKIPSEVAKSMHDNIKRGDSPGKKDIHYLYGKSKDYGPKNHKRRRFMKHVNSSFESSAQTFNSLYQTQRGPEAAKQERLEELIKELNELGVDIDPQYLELPPSEEAPE